LQRFKCKEVAGALMDLIMELPTNLIPLEPLLHALTGGDMLKSAALKKGTLFGTTVS
jgi:hypothetical protein